MQKLACFDYIFDIQDERAGPANALFDDLFLTREKIRD